MIATRLRHSINSRSRRSSRRKISSSHWFSPASAASAQGGRTAGARNVIEQAAGGQRVTTPEEKEGAMPYVAQAMAEIGDLDGALSQAQTLGKYGGLLRSG